MFPLTAALGDLSGIGIALSLLPFVVKGGYIAAAVTGVAYFRADIARIYTGCLGDC